MGSLASIIVAAVLGVGLATATTFTVVEVAKQTPQETQQVQQPLIEYGSR